MEKEKEVPKEEWKERKGGNVSAELTWLGGQKRRALLAASPIGAFSLFFFFQNGLYENLKQLPSLSSSDRELFECCRERKRGGKKEAKKMNHELFYFIL